jgi:murein DD-endopeptidase MepM/ murein hydrolase activator NlpD
MLPTTPPPTRPGSRAYALSLVVAALLAFLLPSLASSEETPPTTDDPEAQLGEVGDRMDEVAAELDLLHKSDLELTAQLDALDAQIAEQLAVVERTQAAADEAVAQVEAVEKRVADAEERVGAQQEVLEARAVSAYIDAGSVNLDAFFESDDYNEYQERLLLLRRVGEHDDQVLDGLMEAKQELAAEQLAASRARERADDLASQAAAALDELQTARAEKEAVQEALDLRIEEFQSEADSLASEQDRLQQIIIERASQPEPTTTVPATVATTEPASPGTTATGSPTSSVTTTPSTVGSTIPGGPAFQWPLPGVVTSPFGDRWGRHHDGIDIAGNTGDPIAAAAGGTVILAEWFGGYGNCVMVDHGGGFVTLYGHQSGIAVSEGDTVSAGQTVGYVGSTGHSTGPHLHFEVRVGGVPYDPMLYLP